MSNLVPMVVEQSSKGKLMIFTQDYSKKELFF